MSEQLNARQRRNAVRQPLQDAYKASIEQVAIDAAQEAHDAIVSRSLGLSYNRVLNGAYGYIVDCQRDATPLRQRNGGRTGRVKVVTPM